MKRSAQVPASLIALMAASLAVDGCSSGGGYYSQCVDGTGRMLPNSACSSPAMGGHWVRRRVDSGGFGGSSYGGSGSGGSFGG